MNLARKSSLSRAEQLRQRRDESTQTRAARSRTYASHPAAYPVTVRNGSGSRVHERSKKRPRRQYYYSVGATGTEIRLPAIPTIRADWKWVSVAITLVMIVLIFFMMKSPEFAISTPEVVGLERLASADLETVLRLQGTSILDLNVNVARTQLAMAFPELKNIQITTSLPAKITITAQERQPVLVWQNGDTTLWVDTEGVIIPPRGQVEPLPTIQADALPPLSNSLSMADNSPAEAAIILPPMVEASILQNWGRQMDKDLLLTALKLTKFVPEGTTIAYSNQHGLGWMDTQGWYVYIGLTMDEIDLKMTEYQEIVKQVQRMGLSPKLISVETVHAPYLRMEQ